MLIVPKLNQSNVDFMPQHKRCRLRDFTQWPEMLKGSLSVTAKDLKEPIMSQGKLSASSGDIKKYFVSLNTCEGAL